MPDVLLRCGNGFMHDSGQGKPLDVVIPSDPAAARRVQDDIEDALKAHGFAEREIFSVKLALEEALVNAIKHGNQLDPDKRVAVSYQVTCERFDIRIVDEGSGFNPEDVPDPTDITKVYAKINCLSCHQPHSSAQADLLIKDQPNNLAFCSSCHKDLTKR